MLFKPQAVKIGNYKSGHYKVIMRFTNGSGSTSDYIRMAEFTIMDKDNFQQNLLISIVVVIIGTVFVMFLRSCGFPA
jgi:hypothetical protein